MRQRTKSAGSEATNKELMVTSGAVEKLAERNARDNFDRRVDQFTGRFYEEVGAIRDVVQNHLLQVLVLLAMDAPVSSDPETMRDEKVRLFKAIKALTPAEACVAMRRLSL